MADHRDEDEQAGGAVDPEGEPDPEPVDEGVDREPEAPSTPTRGGSAPRRARRGGAGRAPARRRRRRGSRRRPAVIASWASPMFSIPSGSTSKRATATTMPPLSAITVGSVCESRRAIWPPTRIATTAGRRGGWRPRARRPSVQVRAPGSAGRCRAAPRRGCDVEVGARLTVAIARSSRWVGEGGEQAALLADQVVVMAAGVEALVAGRVAADVDALDQPQLLELLERAVDARPARRRAAGRSPARSARSSPPPAARSPAPGAAAAVPRLGRVPFPPAGPSPRRGTLSENEIHSHFCRLQLYASHFSR